VSTVVNKRKLGQKRKIKINRGETRMTAKRIIFSGSETLETEEERKTRFEIIRQLRKRRENLGKIIFASGCFTYPFLLTSFPFNILALTLGLVLHTIGTLVKQRARNIYIYAR